MDPLVRCVGLSMERALRPLCSEGGGKSLDFPAPQHWSGNGSHPGATSRQMGLMWPLRIARSSRRLLGAQEGLPQPAVGWTQERVSDVPKNVAQRTERACKGARKEAMHSQWAPVSDVQISWGRRARQKTKSQSLLVLSTPRPPPPEYCIIPTPTQELRCSLH